ncbi:MAG TPA: N(4)-(beta-N-acetylglucosaminyl)-L-asparaginase [Planctomycetaceae bacterium]|nr:N(4)-(beta-N-acetylglucosaminyl)-L-asparaginase [Planctomycetaceae bacterium]
MPHATAARAISSHNGLQATRRAYDLMQSGSDPLDAAVAGVTLVEDDPDETSVGYGGLPNEDGVVELDAAVMHGPTHRAGGVAALANIRNPAQVARLVMRHSDHVLLAGDGALRFARAHGFQEQNLLTDKARRIWLYWKQTLSPRDDWLPPPDGEVDPDVAKFFKIARGPAERIERPTGTVHLAAINAAGDISCVTSTSGLAFKIPGRVGDSAIIGAGLYVDNAIGSCGSTGRGEATLQNLASFAAVELMRAGVPPADAGLDVLRRVVRTCEPRLLKDDGTPDFDLKLYLLAKDGRHAAVSLWGPAQFAVTDGQGTRHEECVYVHEKQTASRR